MIILNFDTDEESSKSITHIIYWIENYNYGLLSHSLINFFDYADFDASMGLMRMINNINKKHGSLVDYIMEEISLYVDISESAFGDKFNHVIKHRLSNREGFIMLYDLLKLNNTPEYCIFKFKTDDYLDNLIKHTRQHKLKTAIKL